MYCVFKSNSIYLDTIGKIIDEGSTYYIVEVYYYRGGNRIFPIKKGSDDIKLFDTIRQSKNWINNQNYLYTMEYENGKKR